MFTGTSSNRRRAVPVAVLALGLLAACADQGATPLTAPLFNAAGDNAALVEVGEHSFPAGLVVPDAANQLILLYRWNNGFCGGTAATEFVQSTYRDVIQLDERWRDLDKTEGMWFYVYPWDGTTFVSCAYLRNTAPLATGRGNRLLHDNDFYPFGPYGPGPGANTYFVKFQGSLLTPAGDPVRLLGMIHITADADGQTIRNFRRELRLSPDPR